MQLDKAQNQITFSGGLQQLLKLVKIKYEEQHASTVCLEVVRALAHITRGNAKARVDGRGVLCVQHQVSQLCW